MQKKGREVASCLFHHLSPFICTCSRCRFFMLEVAAKTASRYFFPKIARYRFCIRGLGVYELCLYPIKAFFDCEAPPGDVFCTHIACFHIPTWGFARKNALFFKKLNLPTGFRIVSYFSKMHNIKAASFTVSTIILT